MTAGNHVPKLCLLILVISSFIGTVAATEYFVNGGYFSTGTSVSVPQGTVNETVSIQYTTIDEGMARTTEWFSSQTLNDPSALAWNSQLSIGTNNDSLWWDFQMQGLPLTWIKTETILPVTVQDVRTPPILPGTWREIRTPPVLPVALKNLYLF